MPKTSGLVKSTNLSQKIKELENKIHSITTFVTTAVLIKKVANILAIRSKSLFMP